MDAPKLCWSYIIFFFNQRNCFLPEKSAQFKIAVQQYLDFLVKLVLLKYSSMQVFIFIFQNLHPISILALFYSWMISALCHVFPFFFSLKKPSKTFKPLCQSSSSSHYCPMDIHQKLIFLSQIVPNFIYIPCHKHTQGTIFTQN